MSMFNTSLSDYWKLFFLKIIANFASQLYKHRCVLENNWSTSGQCKQLQIQVMNNIKHYFL